MRETKDPRAGFGEALLAEAEKNERILAISADSSSGSGMTPFRKRFPERHIEFGIMEQGILGYASGLASIGWIPFVAAIAPFVTARPFEMFRNDLGYMRQNVKIVGRNPGLTYSDLGATHQSLDDVAILRTIPGVVVICPGTRGDPWRGGGGGSRGTAVHPNRCAVHPHAALPGRLFRDRERHRDDGRPRRHHHRDRHRVLAGLRCGGDAAAQGISPRLISMHTVKPIDRD